MPHLYLALSSARQEPLRPKSYLVRLSFAETLVLRVTSRLLLSTAMPEKSAARIKSPDQFVLKVLKDERTQDYTRRRNAETWLNLLSDEDYIRREKVLALSKMATADGNKLMVFALCSVEQPSIPLCSCEIMIRPAHKYKLSESKQVTREQVRSGCIGGVYSYPENRGRGLATLMIDKLVALMKRPEHLGPHGIILLYSEVGDFYTRNGFQSFHVPLLDIPLTPSGKTYEMPTHVELIKYKGFSDLFQAYASDLDKRLRNKTLADGIDRLTLVPTADIVDWFHLRTKFFGTKIFGETKEQMIPEKDNLEDIDRKAQLVEPHYFGIKLTCKNSGKLKGFIAWQQDYDKDKETGKFQNQAIVLNIYVEADLFDVAQVTHELIDNMKEYFEAEHEIPQVANFHNIVIWESEISQPLVQELVQKYNCEAGLKNSSLSAMLCNDAEEDRNLRSGRLLWDNNTKLSWF